MMKKQIKAHNTNKTGSKKVLIKILIGFSLIILTIVCAGLIYFGIMSNKYQLDVNKLTSLNNGVRVYSSSFKENTLCNTNRSIIKLDDLPEYIPDAFISIEDKRFYQHSGYDLKRIIKAGMVNTLTKSKSQGASTISQQLIKNALLSNEKTYQRKLQEVILSIKMEKQFTKQQILEMYLNTIYFGQNAYGIENASQVYFGKSAKELTLDQACCLAGIIKSPANYSPKTKYQNAVNRRNLVAKKMFENQKISYADFQNVVNSEIDVVSSPVKDFCYECEAIYEACKLLNITERELINRNYEIVTNKQDDLQAELININKQIVSSAEETYSQDLDSISIVANNNGEVLAYFVNSNYNLHNMKRQPASLIKPLAVYLPCFKYNILTPATQILDEPIDYNGFKPKNADGNYLGYMSVREALADSQNIPAVKALDYLGVDRACEMLNDLGISTKPEDRNLALALGAVFDGVTLENILSAYITIANYGSNKPLSFVKEIKNDKGEIIYSAQEYSEKIIDDASCFLLTDCLRQSCKTGSAKRLNELNIDIASKTGTAFDGKNNTDIYNVAYTSENTVLTWISNIKDNALSKNLHSSAQPTEINKQVLKYMYSNHRPNNFKQPEEVVYSGYDVIEYENNHNIIAPRSELDRYIAYDYFKEQNLPEQIDEKPTDLIVTLDKSGSYLYFDASMYKTYILTKQCNGQTTILANISEKSGKIEIKDTDVFKYDEIEYILTSTDKVISSAKIRPKDYLIGLIESQMLNGKLKWFV